MFLSAPQIVYHALNGIKKPLIPIADGNCRICGGPLIGQIHRFDKYDWGNWNGEDISKDRNSIYVCDACIAGRNFRTIQNKAKKGFIASLGNGLEYFQETDYIIQKLKNLPEPPFVLCFMMKHSNIPALYYQSPSYSRENVRAVVFMEYYREMTALRKKKIKPPAPEIYSVIFEPDELLETVNMLRKNKDILANTLEIRENCMSDPCFALAAWLAGYTRKDIYKYFYKKESA